MTVGLTVTGMLILSYLLGSIPFGLLVGRIYGIDIRDYGSGNIGMSNTLRTLGLVPALAVLICDMSKGALSVWLAGQTSIPLLPVLAGIVAIMGSNWSIFLRFSGGKGVGATVGVLLALFPGGGLLFIGIWCLIVLLTRYISLASMGAISIMPAVMLIFSKPVMYSVATAILAAFIIYRHLDNIKRLLSGTETRFGEKVKVK